MTSAQRRLAPISAHLSTAGSDAAELAVNVEAVEADLVDMADAHLIQPYDKLDRPNTKMIQSSGRGIYLITDKGEEIIDGPGGMWTGNVGSGEARLAEAIGTQVRASAWCRAGEHFFLETALPRFEFGFLAMPSSGHANGIQFAVAQHKRPSGSACP